MAAGAGLRLSLLGAFRVVVGDREVPDDAWRLRKPRQLLKILALAPDHRLHREQVMDLLWPDLDPAAAANNLHKSLHVLRNVLEPERAPSAPSTYVQFEGEHIALRDAGGGEVWVDVAALE